MVLAACVLLVAGCGGGKDGSEPRRTPTPTDTATAVRTAVPQTIKPPPVPARYRAQAAKLPLAQRIGQLMVVGFEGTDLTSPVFDELAGHGWAGIYVGPQNAVDLTGVGTFAGEARVRALAADRLAPLVAAFDDDRPEHLGATSREAASGAATAGAAANIQGVTLTTAPFLDVGIGADADLIAKVAPAAIKAWADKGVAPAPGHFPGQGAVTQDPLDGPANVGSTAGDLAGRDLKPFLTALKDAPAVTVSSATFTAYDPVTPAALTPTVVQDLLRGGLRFGGVAMSDDLETLAVQTGGSQAAAGLDALRAGIDLLFVPDAAERGRVYDALLKAAKSGRLPRARVNDAVARVLRLKARFAR